MLGSSLAPALGAAATGLSGSSPTGPMPPAAPSGSMPPAGAGGLPTAAPPAVPQQSQTTPLYGAGWHQWNAWQDGGDVRGTGIGTVFGGGNDSGDNSVGAWNNPIGPTTQGVSLPTGRILATQGSPFPDVPMGTLVDVYNHRTGKSVTVPRIDEGPTQLDGPAAGDGGNGPGSAMVDIASATAKSLGMDPDGSDPVDIRIHGGAQYLTPQNYQESAAPMTVSQNDDPLISKIGSTLVPSIQSGNIDGVRSMLGKLQSPAIRDQVRTLDAALDQVDNVQENRDAESQATAKQYTNQAKTIWGQIVSRYRNLQGAQAGAQAVSGGGLLGSAVA